MSTPPKQLQGQTPQPTHWSLIDPLVTLAHPWADPFGFASCSTFPSVPGKSLRQQMMDIVRGNMGTTKTWESTYTTEVTPTQTIHHLTVITPTDTPQRLRDMIGQTPGQTPGQTVRQTPGQPVGQTPGRTPDHIITPGQPVGQTPGRTPIHFPVKKQQTQGRPPNH